MTLEQINIIGGEDLPIMVWPRPQSTPENQVVRLYSGTNDDSYLFIIRIFIETTARRQ